LADAAPADSIAGALARAGPHGISLGRLATVAGLSLARAAECVAVAHATLGHSRIAVLRTHAAALRRERLAIFARHDTLTRKRLAALMPMAGAGPLNDTLAALASEGRLLRDGGTLRLHIPAREAALAQARASAVETATSRLAEALRSAGLSPPDPARLAPDPASARLLEGLVRDGIAIQATDTVQKRCFLFHRDAVDLAKRRLAPLLSQAPGLLVGEAGAAPGISRKHSVPLLEYLDAIHFTRRVGDRRVLARPA
jgi:selenocysteine-specific elongation factor